MLWGLPLFLSAQQVEVTEFSCSDCVGIQVEDEHHFNDRILDSGRVGDLFRIRISVLANCATGSYYDAELVGDTLVLKYGIAKGHEGYFCNCPFEFQYLIANVPEEIEQIAILDTEKRRLGKRLITLSPYTYRSDCYEEGLTTEAYRTLFLEKMNEEQQSLERMVEMLEDLLKYAEEGEPEERILITKIKQYQAAKELTLTGLWMSADSFIKEILGEDYVSHRESELTRIGLSAMALEKELASYGIDLQ